MIAERFGELGADASSGHQALHLHLHVPEQMAAALMQFFATLSQQHFAFPETDTSAGQQPDRRQSTVWPAERQPAAETPARRSEQFAEVASPDRGSLLAVYQSTLKAKKQRSTGRAGIAEHESSCRLFDQWLATHPQTHPRCRTPVVSLLREPDILQDWARWMICDRGLSAVTVGKRLTHAAMVAKAGGIVIDKPTGTELKRLVDSRSESIDTPDDRRIPTFEEIDAMARHVSVAKYPYGDHAPYFARGLIRLAAFIGFRTQDVLSTSPDRSGLRREDICWDSLCPIADVNTALGYDLHSPFGWLHYSVNKDTHSDCRRILVPMPKWLRDWVRFFSELSQHPVKVFPSMQRSSSALNKKGWSQSWSSIRTAAGVDPRIQLSEGKGQTIAIRKYAANWWKLAAYKSKQDLRLAEQLAFYVLHHAEVTTAAKHYLATQALVLPVMIDLMSEFRLPAADAPAVSLLPE